MRPDADWGSDSWDYYDLSQSGAAAELNSGSQEVPGYVPGGSITYQKTVLGSPTGQVMLYRDPPTATP